LERIGLFGGTFNPIHQGHLQTAEEVRARFPLDRIHVIPSAIPPHKVPDRLAGADDRLEMIRLSILDYPNFTASDVEITRPGPSYTIDTVRHCKSIASNDIDMYLILGFDAFLEIDTWKSYLDLLRLIPFIVMGRPDERFSNEPRGWEVLENYLRHRISVKYTFSASRSGYIHPENQPVYIMDINLIDISSTQIRNRIHAGAPIHSLVSKRVEDFITTRGLYL